MQKLVFYVAMLVMLTSCSKPNISQIKKELAKQTCFAVYALKEYPDDPYVQVIFFDVDYDGIPEAFVTYKGGHYSDGWLWQMHQLKNGRWQLMDGSIFARESEFFALTEEGQKPKLIIIRSERKSIEFDDNGTSNWREYISRISYQPTIDKKGHFKKNPIPEFEIKDIYLGIYQDPESGDGFTDFPEIKLKSPNDKLDPVQVETFYPRDFTGKTGSRGDDGGNRERDTNNGNETSDYTSEYPYETTYVVQEGENVYAVSVKTAVPPSVLRKFNGIGNDTLPAGQVLRIPLREPPPNAEED